MDTEEKDKQWSFLQSIKNTYPYIDFTKQETLLHIDELEALPFIIESKSLTPLEASRRLNEYVYINFSYDKTVTDVETTFDEVWTLRAGVCQDFAHVLLVLLRLIDIPARYVSGYICPNKNGMRGEGATHAWVEAYIPGFGWLGLDPTNNCLVQDLHVRLATGRSFRDVSPVKGTYKGTSEHQLEVGVTVSYEGGITITEQPAMQVTLRDKPAPGAESNSDRRHLEMIQQQQ
jgi:transglutaminase-like putative cysteine protease